VSAADRLLVDWATDHDDRGVLATDVYHDRFGALTLGLPGSPRSVITFHSQQTALLRNAGQHKPALVPLLDHPAETVDLAVVRIPKSLALFELYLRRIAHTATPATRVAAGFMTRHFTPRLLEIAAHYAGSVEQSKARKKARLLLLGELRRPTSFPPTLRSTDYEGKTYLQYPGVFSADHIDYATQFLLDTWQHHATLDFPAPATVLDVACGNGIIGDALLRRYPEARLFATDDSILAVRSARTNLPRERATVYWEHTLAPIADATVDLAVINPPFHFGYENNIGVSLGLFRQIHRTLRVGGSLVVVANRHLNYATHLRKIYRLEVVAENDKYVIYRCDRD
jgi:16S rRNA G1207 methylase RsmC